MEAGLSFQALQSTAQTHRKCLIDVGQTTTRPLTTPPMGTCPRKHAP